MLGYIRYLSFSPSLLPSLAALGLIGLTSYLGYWQQGRAAEKRQLQAEFDSRRDLAPIVVATTTVDPSLRYRSALAQGTWRADGQIFVDNKIEDGRVGYHVIAPLKLAETDAYLLINRGWIARTADYPRPPTVSIPAGPVKVEGILSVPSSRFIELSKQTVDNRVWQNLTVERYRAHSGLNVLPYVLLAGQADAPLKKVVEQPDARVEKHIEYMLTWYSLAITVVIIWLVTNFRREASKFSR